MRALVVSDVHSNIEALAAVLRDAESRGEIDALWCAGDIVGYGPDPSEALAMLRARDAACVAGNHDLAACEKMGITDFNPVAAQAAMWTADALTDSERAHLASLPLVLIEGACTIVHGSLRDPGWEYLLSGEQALEQFVLQTTLVSIVGHSHLPFWCEESPGAVPLLSRAGDGDAVALGDARLILNPGSSGQPRDGDPRASYLLYDDAAGTVTWHRVEYDIAATQRKIAAAGLPSFLAERLAVGR